MIVAAVRGRSAPQRAAATITSRLLGAVTPGVVLDAGRGSPDGLLHLSSGPAGVTRSQPAPTIPQIEPTSLPARLADTRSGLGGVPVGRIGSHGGHGSRFAVPVLGRVGVPTTGIAAVALNITVTDSFADDAGGHLSVHPCDIATPDVSTLNFVTGQTVANAAIVPVAADGRVCIAVRGLANVIVDLVTAVPTGGGFIPVDPARIVDTRSGIGGAPITRIGDGTTLRVPVTGRAGLPTTGISAVSINITAATTTAPDTGGYITAHPCGTTPPNVSTLNFTTGQTIANAAIVPVAPDGTICITATGRTDIIIDLNGAFTDGSTSTVG